MKMNMGKSFAQGYEMAQNEFSKLAAGPKTSEEWVAFFRSVIQNQSDLDWNCGAAAFVTSEEVKAINVGLLSKELSTLGKRSEQYSHDSSWVDRLLPRPEYLDTQGPAVDIPISLRPDYSFDKLFDFGTGKLGRIYMKETGMHMYLPHCDIYDSDDPDMLLCVGDQLDETSVRISELLSVLQEILDPRKKNQELTQAIERCKNYEQGNASLPAVLKKYGLGVVNLSENSWHRVNYQNIHAESLYMELDDHDHLQVVLEPRARSNRREDPFDATEANFDLSGFIREAINRARNKRI